MLSRIAYGLSALLIGAGALTGVQFSSAEWTGQSNTQAVIAAAPDWTPPMVAVDDPGYALWGTTTISATASDSISAIASVHIEYRLQGSGTWTELCTDLVAPFSCSWNTTTVPDGVYFLRATALDSEGNSHTSDELMTEVRNTPSVVIDPVATPTRGTVRLTARVVNVGAGLSTITFQGAPAGSGAWVNLVGCTGPGPEAFCDFDSTLYPSGTYDLRAFATVGVQTYTDVQPNIVVDNTAPTVTVNKAAGQADPTNASPITFTVVFSEAVFGFDESDVSLGGTSGGTKAAVVSGSGPTYTVTVTGMSGDGTVTASVPSARVVDHVGNANTASTSTDNSVQFDGTPLTVTINQAVGQADPVNASSSTINFTVVFNRSVTGFATGDVTISGTAGGSKTATVTGSGTTYNVAVTGATGSGTVTVALAAGVAIGPYGFGNEASTSTDDTVTRDVTAPTLTINQAAGQADPSNASTINFTVVFSEPVTGFASNDITYGGTAAGTKSAVVTGGPAVYNVAVSGMTGSGVTLTASVAATKATDLAGNDNTASTSTDNTVTRDVTVPTVAVIRAASQATPTTSTPVNFTVTFSEAVTGFDTGDLTLTGTAPGTLVGTVTGGPTVYNVAVAGMSSDGTLIASVAQDVAADTAGNLNTASPGGGAAGRTVTWNNGLAPSVTVNQSVGQADPTNGTTISFTVVFSEPVTGVAANDFTLTSAVGGTRNLAVIDASTYTVTITGMTANSTGTVQLSLPANKADDVSGTANTASTSTDNTVTRDAAGPTVTINKAAGQADPVTVSGSTTVNFTVIFNEVVTDFATGDVTVTGTAGGTKTATVTGSGTTYNVAVTGMTTAGTVVASIAVGRATDALGNTSAASTSTDNSVSWLP